MMKVLVLLPAACMWSLSNIPSAKSHSWYPLSCCSEQDCEPIPIDAVMVTTNGFHVTYMSPRFGYIDEEVPRTSVRHSEDGSYHGCWRKNNMSPRSICFFAPLNA
jgi:hypothetical protein